jgi:hypothetical protein
VKIAFHCNQLSLRGTEVAIYDYAHFNEKLLGNTSIILTPSTSNGHHPLVIEKFKKRFPVYFYETESDLEKILQCENAQLFYSIRAGFQQNPMPRNIKIAIHAVFQFFEPHGDVYAYISEWLSKKMSNNKYPFVPHMINLAESDLDLREELNIADDAVVIGRHGGLETFDLEFVNRTVYSFARNNPDKYFIFLNTNNFIKDIRKFYRPKEFNWLGTVFYPQREFPNLIFIEGTDDSIFKRKFINSCDCMLHARKQGESFGLAVGEFSFLGKPVITCNKKRITDTAHFELLGDNAFYYSSSTQLKRILNSITHPAPKLVTRYAHFNPENVMKKFSEVFLN